MDVLKLLMKEDRPPWITVVVVVVPHRTVVLCWNQRCSWPWGSGGTWPRAGAAARALLLQGGDIASFYLLLTEQFLTVKKCGKRINPFWHLLPAHKTLFLLVTAPALYSAATHVPPTPSLLLLVSSLLLELQLLQWKCRVWGWKEVIGWWANPWLYSGTPS